MSSCFFINIAYLRTPFKFIFAIVVLYYDSSDTLNVFTTQDLGYGHLHEVAVVFLTKNIYE